MAIHPNPRQYPANDHFPSVAAFRIIKTFCAVGRQPSLLSAVEKLRWNTVTQDSKNVGTRYNPDRNEQKYYVLLIAWNYIPPVQYFIFHQVNQINQARRRSNVNSQSRLQANNRITCVTSELSQSPST